MSSNSPKKGSRTDSYQTSHELGKKKLLSAMVLMMRDKIAEEKSRSQSSPGLRSTDSFWSELETMLARHESQMEKLAQQAVEMRSTLSAQRKSANAAHQARMKEATAELDELNRQISEYTSQIEKNQEETLAAKESALKDEIADTNTEIDQLTKKISIMRKNGKELKEKLEESRKEAASMAENLRERKKRTQRRAGEIGDEIKDTLKRISELDEELSALETKEAACTALYARLKEDLPLAQRIFGKY